MSAGINEPIKTYPISLTGWSNNDRAQRTIGPNGEPFSLAIVLTDYPHPYKGKMIPLATREVQTLPYDFGEMEGDKLKEGFKKSKIEALRPLFLIPAFSPNDLRVITNIFKESLTCFNTTLGQIFGYHLLKKIDQLSEKIKLLNPKNKLQTTVEIASANIKSSFYQHLLFRDQLPYILAKYPRAYVGVIDASLESDEKLKNEFESLNEKFNPNNLTETERQTAPELIQEIKDVIQVWGRYLDMPHYHNYWVERRIESVPLVNRLVDPIHNLTEASKYLLFPYQLASAQVSKECLPECMQKIPECAKALKRGDFPHAFAISRRAGMTFGKTSFNNYLAFQRHIGTIVEDIFTEYEQIPLKKSLTSADALSFLEVQSRIRNTSVQNLIATQSRGEDFASSQSIDNMTFRVYEALKTIRHFYNTKSTDLDLPEIFQSVKSEVQKLTELHLDNFNEKLKNQLNLLFQTFTANDITIEPDFSREKEYQTIANSNADLIIACFIHPQKGSFNLPAIQSTLQTITKDIQDKAKKLEEADRQRLQEFFEIQIEPLLAISLFQKDLYRIRDLSPPPQDYLTPEDLVKAVRLDCPVEENDEEEEKEPTSRSRSPISASSASSAQPEHGLFENLSSRTPSSASSQDVPPEGTFRPIKQRPIPQQSVKRQPQETRKPSQAASASSPAPTSSSSSNRMRLPKNMKGRDVIKVLLAQDFDRMDIGHEGGGSHHTFKHKKFPIWTTVPLHDRELPRGTLKSIFDAIHEAQKLTPEPQSERKQEMD